MAAPLLALLSLLLACRDDGPSDGAPLDDTGPVDTGWTPQPYDEFWGEAPDQDTRLALYDALYSAMRADYAAFGASGVDWDAVYADFRPRIARATSQGRWFRLLDQHYRLLQDRHTFLYSFEVCGTDLGERPPLFWHASDSSLLGACVSLLPDDTLLVYKVEIDNPAGLEVGDRLVGYDGQSWRELLGEIEASGMPWCGTHASADSAEDRVAMEAMPNNAHLYAGLDYLPVGRDEAVTVSTDGLIGRSSSLLCSHQLPRDDVAFPWPDWNAYGFQDGISHGVVDGDIGLIYAYAWTSAESEPFADAVGELVAAGVRGIVLDHRFNIGGGSGAALGGLDQLFDTPVERIMQCALRDDDSEDITALAMSPTAWHDLDPDPTTVFDGPIAVLTGPHSLSAGDLVPYYLSFYDNVRRFGTTTNGSFGAMTTLWSASEPDEPEDLYATYTYAACVDADLDLLQGREIVPEEEVWLDAEGVVAGEDAVLEAALRWIDEETL